MDNNIVRYSVQVGAFRSKEAAQDYAKPLYAIGYPVAIIKSGDLYMVLVGNYSILEEATEAEMDLKELGFDTIIKRFEETELNI